MMYRCEDCGNLFEEGEQAIWTEDFGECHGYPTRVEMSGCPLCQGSYEEAKECKICGSYVSEGDSQYCNECQEDVRKRFLTFINSEFIPEERELLNYLYDGEEI